MEIGEIKEEKRLSSNKRIKILGVSVDILSMNETVRIVDEYIRTKTPLHLMGVNADKLNECEDNPLMKKIVNSCGIINADGASVVLASKRLFKDDALSERVAGIDLMMELVKLSSERGYRVYLLGARKQIVEETKKELVKTFPNVKIVGIHDGYFKEEEWANVSEEIRKARPDIVFVGITSPTKEYLIEYLQNNGHNEVFMGVGGSFDVISKEIKRAPKWMQKMNLEWLYRVKQEPKRLFKRYFIGNNVFMYRIAKEKRRKKRSGK